jgi:alkylation response protein AidB-like acyl-CoA dehydrogenase
MEIELNEAQRAAQVEFRAFVDMEVEPYANEFDRKQQIPEELIQTLGARGYLGALVPVKYGGSAMDSVTWGLLCEAIGRGSASLLSLLTVHSMVIHALLKWGTEEQRTYWLPKLATGETVAAFGLTEPGIGSDAANCETTAAPEGEYYILNGRKRWISFGQVADLFLIFCVVEDKPSAFLVERDREGFRNEPIGDMLGFRSAMLAELHMGHCRVPAGNLVGRIGFGFTHVAGAALDHGRFCVAWGALGIIQGCVDACLEYTGERKQFGAYLREHQLIQKMIADMLVQARAARLMCYHAAYLKECGVSSMIMETSIAKYFTSQVAVKVALDAVQIHGANGCSDKYPVARYMRDAKVLEIIEGSNQIQQIIIAKYGCQEHVINKRRKQQQGDVQ